MVKRLFLMLALGAAVSSASAQSEYQISNGDFESDWEKCYPWEKGAKVTTAYGTQPTGWCMSNVPNSLAGTIGTKVAGVSGYAAQITNTSAMGNGIPAYMTLGTTWATAESKSTSVRNKDGGVFGGVSFTHCPDALSIKYKRDNSKSASDVSTIAIYTWKGTWTQTNVPSNTAVGVFSWGSATKVTMTDRDVNILGKETDATLGDAATCTEGAELIASKIQSVTGSASSWTTLVVPLDYESNNKPEKLNIVIAAAGYLDGGASITDGVSITVDDVTLLYYSELASATYDGNSLTFDTNGKATVNDYYDAQKLSVVSTGKAATIETLYIAATAILTIKIKGENYSEDNTNYHTYKIQFANPKATMAIGEALWGTFVAPFDVTIPSGVKAYKVTGTEQDGHLSLTEVSSTIAANTPVVLNSSAAISKVFNGNVKDGASITDTPSEGLLTGAFTATPITSGYVLQKQGDKVGFYQVSGTKTIPANRAYLNTTSSVKGFYFEEATGIDRVENVEMQSEMYDLSGRRVKNATKGVYIINGKKVLK